jgi:hypothetical protein
MGVVACSYDDDDDDDDDDEKEEESRSIFIQQLQIHPLLSHHLCFFHLLD